MLIIRQAQLEAIQQERAAALGRRLEAEMARRFPEATGALPPGRLRQIVEECRGGSAGYGLTRVAHLERYLAFVVEFGGDGLAAPELRQGAAILAQDEKGAAEKLDELEALAAALRAARAS